MKSYPSQESHVTSVTRAACPIARLGAPTATDMCTNRPAAHDFYSRIHVTDPVSDILWRIYDRAFLLDAGYTIGPMRLQITVCHHCNWTRIYDYLDSLPRRELPKLINFPWEAIGGSKVYKYVLAGDTPITEEVSLVR